MDTAQPRPCAAASALEVVGERWSLLIVRELFYGVHRFEGIQRATGAPRNMLASRLRTLEAAGILERRQYSERPPRHEYVLTESGRALMPVLVALHTWGDTHLGKHPVMPLRHRDGGRSHRLRAELRCATCDGPIHDADVSIAMPDPWASRV